MDAGNFKLRAGLLEVIAGIALSQVEGALGTGIRSEHPEDKKKRKNLTKGIRAEMEEGKVLVELDVSLDYGKDFNELGRLIQAKVKEAVG